MFVPISNCVTSSSPTTGLRTIHLLRSILFLALPSHAIPANPMLCLHFYFNIKWDECQSLSITTLSCNLCFTKAAEIPCGFSCGWTVLVADAVEFTCCHVDDETLLTIKCLLNNTPLSVCLQMTGLLLLFFIFLTLFPRNCAAGLFILTFFPPSNSTGSELHSGILYATYAVLCRSGPIIT